MQRTGTAGRLTILRNQYKHKTPKPTSQNNVDLFAQRVKGQWIRDKHRRQRSREKGKEKEGEGILVTSWES